jgi:hypothetical protein
MSGSFRINFLEPKFVYHYEDDYSKIFKDEEQSNDFFDGREKLSKKIFLTLHCFMTGALFQKSVFKNTLMPNVHLA